MRKTILKGCFALVAVCLAVFIGFTMRVNADLTASEAGLNGGGNPYELNPDISGKLWISDSSAGEVWGVNATSGDYQVFSVTGSPVDARKSGDYVYWADGMTNLLGRVHAISGAYTHWLIPDAVGFLGTNLDASGRLYATDSINPYLFRLNPGTNEVCEFVLNGAAASTYVVRDGDYLWIGDWFDSRIFRLKTTDNSLTWWQLPAGSYPFGMVPDGSGNLWFADNGNGAITLLNPSAETNQLTIYTLPATAGDYPQMVALQSGAIWYTEQGLASLGSLDPLVATHTSVSATVHTQTLTPSCSTISPSSTSTMTIDTGTLTTHNKTYGTIVNADGWLVYSLPANSDPWGIALLDYGYMVDAGRQVLSRFTPPPTAVDLVGFTATSTPRAIQLDWSTAQESNVTGFNLYRADTLSGPKLKLNSDPIPALTPGQLMGNSYRHFDRTSKAGNTYYYWVEWVGTDGSSQFGPAMALQEHYTWLPSILR